MHLHRLLLLICVVHFTIGCASKPPELDNSIASSPTTNDYVRMAIARQSAATSQNGFDRVKHQLVSGSESDRIRACESLAQVASENETDTESINLLANVMKTDESMKVRMAATDALGLLQGGEMNNRVASMLPANDLPAEPSTRLSFIKQLWR